MRVAALLVAWVLLTACSPGAPGSDAPEDTNGADPSASEPAMDPSGSSSGSDSPSDSPSDTASPRIAPDPSASATSSPEAPRSSIARIGGLLRRRMSASHRPGCPVPLSDLRYLRVPYVDFGGRSRTGELVVHRDHAEGVVRVFERLYEAQWPIERMRLVDEYAGDDDASMADNNTSAYNCRPVSGTSRWSEHAYGAAIDLNPVQNPYVTASGVAPPAGSAFADLDRSSGSDVPPGTIRADDVVVRAFAGIGWAWGGDWTSSKDYQHFSASGN